MKPVSAVIAWLLIFCAIFQGISAQSQTETSPTQPGNPASMISLPAGTMVELALTAPVWSRTAKVGDPLFAQTDFPVATGNHVAIPAGSFVQGTILSVLRPKWRSSRAQIQILFNKIIFANGYVIALPPGNLRNVPDTIADVEGPRPTAVTVNIEVSAANDLLLDNGAEIEITLASSLSINAREVADALPLTRAPDPGKLKSASLCRPTPGSPGSPGTPDTVIPGSSGTPDVTIPGGPGMPDTTIPGAPATPPTVIPGTPGTPGFPGRVCPAPPMVISSVPLALKATPGQSASATPHP